MFVPSFEHKKSLCFYHSVLKHAYYIKSDSIQLFDKIDIEELMEYVKTKSPDILLVDSASREIVISCFSCAEFSKRFFVSSLGDMISPCKFHMFSRYHGQITLHTMLSWSLEEYQSACKYAMFYQSVKKFLSYDNLTKQECISAKFRLAGHNARWFFCDPYDKVELCIRRAIRNVSSMERLLSHDIGVQAKLLQHHLVAILDICSAEGYVFVSEAAARCLFEKKKFLTFQKFKEFALRVSRNRSLHGWSFEYEFISVIHYLSDGQVFHEPIQLSDIDNII